MENITKRLTIWAVLVTGVLMIPFLGKFPWTAGDYIFAGVVLYGAATTYELVTRNMQTMHRIMVGAAIGVLVLGIWGWAVA